LDGGFFKHAGIFSWLLSSLIAMQQSVSDL